MKQNLGCVEKTLCNDETNPKTYLTDPHIWWNMFLLKWKLHLN